MTNKEQINERKLNKSVKCQHKLKETKNLIKVTKEKD